METKQERDCLKPWIKTHSIVTDLDFYSKYEYIVFEQLCERRLFVSPAYK